MSKRLKTIKSCSPNNKNNEATKNPKPAKKAKQNHRQDVEDEWNLLQPYLRMASKTQVENLAKELFQELRKTRNSGKVVSDITAPLLSNTNNKDYRIANSTWSVVDYGGTLTLRDGIRRASFEIKPNGHSVFSYEFTMQSCNMGRLHYKGYSIYVTLKYDQDTDTIKGHLFGARKFDVPCIRFTARRQEV